MVTTSINVKIKRLWHGKASVRDYIVAEAYARGCGLELECDGKITDIPHDMLNEGVPSQDSFVSKHDGRTYRLVDFPWAPRKDDQLALL